VPNPSELFSSEAFAGILKKLAEKYDRIILDSPPVAPVTDSQILSAVCDITLLVLKAEKSTRRHSQQARDGLLAVGGHILGVIVNDISAGLGHYGYSSYGYYSNNGYYHNGSAKENKPD
jgi:Mrp family chromosome partitioning ATPase